jgi:citrate synthase
LERVVLADDYFIERKLYPNVDFYSGIFSALAGNVTPTFAVARTVGWVAHWNEMITDPETRLSRPPSSIPAPPSAPSCRLPSAPSSRHWSGDLQEQ